MGAAPRLNVQGLARRDEGLMRCIVPVVAHDRAVSIDLGSGEPTVTSHFSRDPRYLYACFEGVGKEPFYDGSVLMIDDIYLMTMSVSPIGRARMRELFETRFDGIPFWAKWLEDAEYIKGLIKKERQLHKMLALALGYGMGPKKMVKQCYDNGHTMDMRTAKEFYAAYWRLFAGVRRLSDQLQALVQRRGWIVNPFGYRLTPEPHKAFNAFIQSTVSGIMHAFCAKVAAVAPYAHLDTIIHDEGVYSVPAHLVEQFRIDKDRATASLNDDLNWSVKIRTGYAVGKNWFEAK